MLKKNLLKFFSIVMIATTTSGCAVAAVDYMLGDNKAQHADDQSASNGGNQGNFK